MNPVNLVSIVIPTYGDNQYLKRAILSALNQSYENIEVIVVDDNGLNTIKQLENSSIISELESDKRLKYVCHPQNKNGSAARNTGVKYSAGDFIALLDDDDEYYANKIEHQLLDLMNHPQCGISFCCADRYNCDRLIGKDIVRPSTNYTYELLMHFMHIQTSSLLIRKDVWAKVNGFDETFIRHQDWEFLARVSMVTQFYPSDFIGYRYYIVQRNRPSDPFKMKELRMHYLIKMNPIIEELDTHQQKEIYLQNRLSVAFEFLKRGYLKTFIKEWLELRPGIFGLRFLFKRVVLRK